MIYNYADLHRHLHVIRSEIHAAKYGSALPSSPITPLPEKQQQPASPCVEDLTIIESLCKTMSSQGFRNYIVSHLSDVSTLRIEVPSALKLAPNPPKLVLECFSRFSLEGTTNVFNTRDSSAIMIKEREASLLVLELLLLMSDGNKVNVEVPVKEEADLIAVVWRERLDNAGGLDKAWKTDARGLLLYIACFGIPGVFTNEEISDLIFLCNAREISQLLRKSYVLLNRVPEIIKWLKIEEKVKAVDLALTFGLENKCAPTAIFSHFLGESKEIWKRAKQAAKSSYTLVNEANKQRLADLKSVTQCLESHRIHPSQIFRGWKIDEQISDLERVIGEIDKKIVAVEKPRTNSNENEPSNKFRRYNTPPRNDMPSRYYMPLYDVPGDQQKCNYQIDTIPTNLSNGEYHNRYEQVDYDYGGPRRWHGGVDFRERQSHHVSREPVAPGSYDVPGDQQKCNYQIDTIPTNLSNGEYHNRYEQVDYDYGGPRRWHGGVDFRERQSDHVSREPVAPGSYDLSAPRGFVGSPNPSSRGGFNLGSSSDPYSFADSIVEMEPYRDRRDSVPFNVPPRHSSYYN